MNSNKFFQFLVLILYLGICTKLHLQNASGHCRTTTLFLHLKGNKIPKSLAVKLSCICVQTRVFSERYFSPPHFGRPILFDPLVEHANLPPRRLFCRLPKDQQSAMSKLVVGSSQLIVGRTRIESETISTDRPFFISNFAEHILCHKRS